MTITINTDGGSRGNPGPASIGIVATMSGTKILKHSEGIGVATNNTAEYTAVIRALELLSPRLEELKCTNIVVCSDSRLMVEQLSGRFKIKAPHIYVLWSEVKKLEKVVPVPITYNWVQRSENSLADDLVNAAHDTPKR